MTTSIYFFVSYSRTDKVDANNLVFKSENNKKIPKLYYVDENFDNNQYNYNIIYKVDKANKYYFEFEIGDDKYIITFKREEKTFIYEVNLDMGKKIIDIRRKVKQNVVENIEKLEHFIKALQVKNEENKIDELFKDSISLYYKQKGFGFLISLFLKLYNNAKLCSELLAKFKEMNKDPKNNAKNMDRKAYLKKYISDFDKIGTEAESLTIKNNYSVIEFYAILLCYTNYYDKNNFSVIIDELFKKNPNDLYQILLIYNTHIIYPIDQNFNFFNKFIIYTINNKKFPFFQIGLNYIKDLDIYIKIIEENKESIFNKYTKKNENFIVKLDDDLKLKKIELKVSHISNRELPNKIKNKSLEEIQNQIICAVNDNYENKNIFEIIKEIDSIISFSEENKTFLVYFTNNFWKYILNHYNEPKQDNILICYELRDLFFKYYDLVKVVFEKKMKNLP